MLYVLKENYLKHVSIRLLSTTFLKYRKVIPSNLKGKSTSSQQWLTRQFSDPYVEKAKMLNYRCRSAFKLLEINDRFHILQSGQIIIDCGAAPGSWTQVAVDKVNSLGTVTSEPTGMVIAIDKQQIYPVEGAVVLGNSDFTLLDTQKKITNILNGLKPNVILSDMAPSASGIRDIDNENMISLCYAVLRFAVQVSNIGGSFLVKLWQCNELKQFETNILRYFKTVKLVKPNASRSDSAEIFLLARHFKGLKIR